MIIIPEIETVVILVPKCASTSLKTAIRERYPLSFMPYRHMEADGIPFGYQDWCKIGVVRKPIERLWSLYCYLRDLEDAPNWAPGRAERMRASVQMPFHEWVHVNDTVFAQPDDHVSGRHYPFYSVRHKLPENRKSQYVYLRPDLGTIVLRHGDTLSLEDHLNITLPHLNRSKDANRPEFEVRGALRDIFEWDAVTAGGW